MCANDIGARAERYGWHCERLSRETENNWRFVLTSPLGETHRCFTVLCAHDILTAAVFDAWVRYEACRALLAMADDTAHRQHDAVVEWMADPHSKVDPWAVLDAEGHSACAAPEDLPPTGYEALSVDGDKGFGLRDAMRRCKAIESAKQLAAALPSAAPTPLRSRL